MARGAGSVRAIREDRCVVVFGDAARTARARLAGFADASGTIEGRAARAEGSTHDGRKKTRWGVGFSISLLTANVVGGPAEHFCMPPSNARWIHFIGRAAGDTRHGRAKAWRRYHIWSAEAGGLAELGSCNVRSLSVSTSPVDCNLRLPFESVRPSFLAAISIDVFHPNFPYVASSLIIKLCLLPHSPPPC